MKRKVAKAQRRKAEGHAVLPTQSLASFFLGVFAPSRLCVQFLLLPAPRDRVVGVEVEVGPVFGDPDGGVASQAWSFAFSHRNPAGEKSHWCSAGSAWWCRFSAVTMFPATVALAARLGVESGLDVDQPAWTNAYYAVARGPA